jgi:hypothetical protein
MIFPRLALAAIIFACAQGALARSTDSIDLSARSRTINVAVIGDSVANDLGRGLEALFDGKPQVRIVKETKFATGLVRTDYFNWNATARDFLRRERPDAVIVVMGGNDKQPIRIDGKRLDPLSKAWNAEYERRVAHFMDTVRNAHARVYWVGLPEVRLDSLNEAYVTMNGIYRRQAARHKFKYVSIWNKFRTPDGAYSSFGQSLEGVKRRLRMEDGMHFTEAGRLLLAHYIAKSIGLR